MGLFAALVGCGGAPSSVEQQPASRFPVDWGSGQAFPQGTITATPSEVVVGTGQGLGQTRVSWSTAATPSAQVWVRQDTGVEQLFASAPSGEEVAPWIRAASTYTFVLYAAAGSRPEERGAELGSAVVTGIAEVQPPPQPPPEPPPDPPPADPPVTPPSFNVAPSAPWAPQSAAFVVPGAPTLFTTRTIDDNGDAVSMGWDWNADGIADEWSAAVASGERVSASHAFAAAGEVLVRAVARDPGGLSSGWSEAVRVRVKVLPPGRVVASPNVVFIPPGHDLGSTVIAWNAGASCAQVWVSRNGEPEVLMAAAGADAVTVPWIQKRSVYRFRLYAATSHLAADRGALIASASVSALAGRGAAIGVNKFDLALQYLGLASGLSGSAADREVTTAMARKALADARAAGFDTLRVSVTGWGGYDWDTRSDLDLWLSDPAAFWALMDQMVADMASYGIALVPVFVWHVYQFPSLARETLTDLITNPQSQSYLLASRFITEFVTRYRHDPTVYFWELTNELNLEADLDLVARSDRRAAGNYSSAQMIVFIRRLADLVRALDPTRPISSGYALPRKAAFHLSAQPEWSAAGPDWTSDSVAEMTTILRQTHDGVDIASGHAYNGEHDHERFGHQGLHNADYLIEFAGAAWENGLAFYVGEFGDVEPTFSVDPRALFSCALIDRVVELQIPFSSPWIWEFYQFSPTVPNELNIEPGQTDALIAKMRGANARLGLGQ